MNPHTTATSSKLPLTAAERAELLALWRDPAARVAFAAMAAEVLAAGACTERESMEAAYAATMQRAAGGATDIIVTVNGGRTTVNPQPTTN